jgi:hypothetical protein
MDDPVFHPRLGTLKAIPMARIKHQTVHQFQQRRIDLLHNKNIGVLCSEKSFL